MNSSRLPLREVSVTVKDYQRSLQALKDALAERNIDLLITLSRKILDSRMPAERPRVFASYCLIRAYTFQRNFTEARKAALIALQQYDSVAGLHYALACAFLAQSITVPDLLTAARYSLLEALERSPGEPRYLALLAEIYLANGEPEKAYRLYKAVLSACPTNKKHSSRLAFCALLTRRLAECEQLLLLLWKNRSECLTTEKTFISILILTGRLNTANLRLRKLAVHTRGRGVKDLVAVLTKEASLVLRCRRSGEQYVPLIYRLSPQQRVFSEKEEALKTGPQTVENLRCRRRRSAPIHLARNKLRDQVALERHSRKLDERSWIRPFPGLSELLLAQQ